MNLWPGTGRKERGCSVLYMGDGIARVIACFANRIAGGFEFHILQSLEVHNRHEVSDG